MRFKLFTVALSMVVAVGSIGGCAGPAPIEEYTIAFTAIQAAEEAGSSHFAPGFWHKAEENYRLGQKSFRENDFAGAKTYFAKAIQYAEKAENASRLKKFQTGEGFP